MTYHVRNPTRHASLRQDRDLSEEERTRDQEWNFVLNGGAKRVSNSKDGRNNTDENDVFSVVQKEKAPFMSLRDKSEPLVIYSSEKPNYPVEYSCKHTLLYFNADGSQEANNGSKAVTIGFNSMSIQISLQFGIPRSMSGDYNEIFSNVEALQWSLLNEVAKRSGLAKECNVDVQYDEGLLLTPSAPNSNDNRDANHDGRKNRRRARAMISSPPFPTAIYSVGTARPKWSASCSNKMVDLDEAANRCFTAHINLDVNYLGNTNESDLVQDFILSIVRNQVALDAKQLFADDITGLQWISEPETAPSLNGPTKEAMKPPGNDEENSVNVGGNMITENPKHANNIRLASIAIPLATACILLLIWFGTHMLFRKNRKRYKSSKRKARKSLLVSTCRKQLPDIESGSVNTETSHSPRDTQSANSTDAGDVSQPSTTAAIKSSKSSTSKLRRKSTPISVDSPERSAAGLPPRPMAVKRDVSVQLKKKRRKRKGSKKKVLALTRVNSRQNIDELPMISESESECGSESGDEEFSHDGSSYDASVGYLTPTRRSHTDISPQHSPREELYLPESTNDANYEFVIEAPGFSEDLFVKDIAAEGSKSNQVIANVPPRLKLQPWGTTSKADIVNNIETSQSENGAVTDTERQPGHLEIDTPSSSDASFSEEDVSIMDRMMPLPWLANNRKNRMR